MANQDLVYDITKVPDNQVTKQAIYARVGDGGLKAVTVKLVSNGGNYDLTGINVVFEGVKADDTHIIDNNGGTVLDPQGGIFRYVFPPQAFTVKGDYKQAFFKLMRGDQVDTTVDVAIHVDSNIVEMGINSKDYLSDYEALIADVQAKYEASLKDLLTQENNFATQINGIQTAAKNAQDAIDNLNVQIKAGNIVKTSDLDTKLAPFDTVISYDPNQRKLV